MVMEKEKMLGRWPAGPIAASNIIKDINPTNTFHMSGPQIGTQVIAAEPFVQV